MPSLEEFYADKTDLALCLLERNQRRRVFMMDVGIRRTREEGLLEDIRDELSRRNVQGAQ